MRLSPVLVAAMAIATPLGGSLSANAQTADNVKQTTEVFTLETNQQPEKDTGQVQANENAQSFPNSTVVSESKYLRPASGKELKVNSASMAVPGVILPTSTKLTTVQQTTQKKSKLSQLQPSPTPESTPSNNEQTPTPTPSTTPAEDTLPFPTTPGTTQPNTAPEISPPTNQQIPAPTPSTTPAEDTLPFPTTPGTTQPNTTPGISPPNNQQTPAPTPNTTPAEDTLPFPTTPGTTQPNTAPEISPPTNQQIPAPTPSTTPAEDTLPFPTTPGTTQPNTTPGISPPNNQQTPAPTPSTTPGGETPAFPTTPGTTQPNATPEAAEPRVLVSEVVIVSQTGQITPELENEVYRVIRTQPGRTTTRSQLQEDINAIFGTGFFSNVQAQPEDTPLGVRVSFVVQPNPVLTKVQLQANPGTGVASVLPANTTDEIFRNQYGRILNLRDLQEGIKQLTKRYQDQGYVLANVIGAPQVAENGVVTLQVAEGVVENIRVRFRNKEGQETDEKGQPIRGRTQEYIITREVELKPGQVFNRNTVQKDLQRVYGLGLFEDVNVSLDPGTDPSKVDVVVNVAERSSGSIAAGAGISSASGLFGTVSYQQQNLNGRNQKLGAEVQVGERELLFDLRFTDPWIAGDPYRTSYTANIFRRSSISLIFDGDNRDIRTYKVGQTDEGDRPRILRLGGGITFTRPLSGNPYERAEWTASAGLQYQRVSARDADGDLRKRGALYDDDDNLILDRNGNPQTTPLTLSDSGQDDLLLVQLGLQRDRRNNPLQPTSGSFLRFGLDQSVPVGLGSIFLTRLRGSYSQYIPVSFINLSKGPQTLAFNLQGGTILGDLPPYEAFTLGGSNSVRGYEEGGLSSARSYVQATVEYRFPVFSVVSGALFVDVGSDLGSSTKAADLLNKNGSGYGYGLGVRVQSPLGPIRIDYGINDDGDSRINFGIGERF